MLFLSSSETTDKHVEDKVNKEARIKEAQTGLSSYLQQHKDNTKEKYYAMKPLHAKVLQELDE